MKRVMIYGLGKWATSFLQRVNRFYSDQIMIVGLTDSYKDDVDEELRKYSFVPVQKLDFTMFDYLVIAVENKDSYEKMREIIEEMRNDVSVMLYWGIDFERKLRENRIINQYKSDTSIVETIEHIKKHGLSTRNQYANTEEKRYELFLDKDTNYPYVMFYGKRMYMPREEWYNRTRDKRYIINVEEDNQYEGSPHLYTFGEHTVKKNDVLIDAGTCEGNFALKYIDMVKKVFLIESDRKWKEPLELTFKPFESKVVYVWKRIDAFEGRDTTTIDRIVFDNEYEQRVDFIKMDIEGAECGALLGGLDVIRRDRPLLSICGYHRNNDVRNISFILDSLGYRTSTSEGYFFFVDENIDYTLDFRRGMVYGD